MHASSPAARPHNHRRFWFVCGDQDPDPIDPEKSYLPWSAYGPSNETPTTIEPKGKLCHYCDLVKRKHFSGYATRELSDELQQRGAMHDMFRDARKEELESLAVKRRRM